MTRELFPLVVNTHLHMDPEFLNAVPAVTEEEYLDLKNSIQNHGINLEPIRTTLEGLVIDGHTRLQICEELGIEVYAEGVAAAEDLTQWTREDLLAQAIELNATRRQLSPAQLGELRRKMAAADASAREIAAATGCHLATAKRAKAAVGTQDTTRSAQIKQGLLDAHGANAPSPKQGTQIDLEEAIAAKTLTAMDPSLPVTPDPAAIAAAEAEARVNRALADPLYRAAHSSVFHLSGGPQPRASIELYLQAYEGVDPSGHLKEIEGAQAFLAEVTTKLTELKETQDNG